MAPATLKLHRALLRLAKGMLSAWSDWLDAQAPPRDLAGSSSI